MAQPRYLRFACALALTSVSASGCYASHESSRVTPVRDASVRDAPPVRVDAFVARDAGALTCADCDCGWGGFDAGSVPQCESIGLWTCCAAVGPLTPPDLPA